ncbi:MAG: alpha/beta hydrolase-fold protein [Planctomycetota bacterium]
MLVWCFPLITALTAAPAAATGTMQYGTFESPSVGKAQGYAVYLPPGYSEDGNPYPVVIFLHGMWEDERRFEQRIEGNKIIDKLIDEHQITPVIVAIPNGDRSSFFTNYFKDSGKNYEDMVVKDFVPFIDAHYNTFGQREGRAITGSSMGGYGAFKMAFKHPDLFVSVATHSAALLPEDMDKMPERARRMMENPRFKQMLAPVFGDPVDPKFWKDNNPFFLVHNGNATKMQIQLDCGLQDEWGFHEGAKAFHELLDSLKIPHEFGLYPGDHGTGYLKANLYRSFVFHDKAFARLNGDGHKADPGKGESKSGG